jgi:hypothetical protein
MAAFADDIKPFDVKVGLWETTNTMEMGGMPAMPAMPQLSEEQLSKMPPQARKQMEDMMKSKGGAGAPRTTTTKSCITKESLNQAWSMGQENCTRKLVSSTGTQQKIHMECTMPQGTTSGDVAVERVDAEHARGTMAMKMSMSSRGKDMPPMDMKMSFASKYLGADCGDVKPVMAK